MYISFPFSLRRVPAKSFWIFSAGSFIYLSGFPSFLGIKDVRVLSIVEQGAHFSALYTMQRCLSSHHVLSDSEVVPSGPIWVAWKTSFTTISQGWRHGHLLVHTHDSSFHIIVSPVLMVVAHFFASFIIFCLYAVHQSLFNGAAISFGLKIHDIFFYLLVGVTSFVDYLSDGINRTSSSSSSSSSSSFC